MGAVKLVSVQCFKHFRVTITSNLKSPKHCKEAASKANRMLGFINRNFSFKKKDIILRQLNQTPFGAFDGILVASPCKGLSKIRSRPPYGYEDDPVLA